MSLRAQQERWLTNHVGYDMRGAKNALLQADKTVAQPTWELISTADGKLIQSGPLVSRGGIAGWDKHIYYTADFSNVRQAGTFQLRLAGTGILSHPFQIDSQLLEKATLSDLTYYFKGQRSTGLFDAADHHLAMKAFPDNNIDAHGGWYDATGDYGKHLSHLSFSSYFNPQQISLTAYSLFKAYEGFRKRPGTDFRQINRRLFDEALYGADYLVRIQVKGGSFYRSVQAPGPGKLAKDRVIAPESSGYAIKKTKDQSFGGGAEGKDPLGYQVSFRSGGGLSIAALAMAAGYDTSGEFTRKDYLDAAVRAFDFLEANNARLTNDGKENILDDYCALTAATELYRTTKHTKYKAVANRRAGALLTRLQTSWKKYQYYWRADDADRPFFHPSDAGLPVVALLEWLPMADAAQAAAIKKAVGVSLRFEMTITREVNNPFGYARQLVQDTAGRRWTSFFFPHGSEAAPWWQGENARLGSLATAARMGAAVFAGERAFADSLQAYAADQLNWILGLNPYDASMLQGTGYNNPAYGFFGTFEYNNAPGGIVNGITSGVENEAGIDFNLSYAQTGKDIDWRWAEQWLPHAAWYLMALAAGR
ncbi:putative glycosidase [Flavihumibacter petaseus NBRC 106054]|uniref:Putative glycosidase n=2 Tax=Flavihumibacter TaxID=1004301 RepID=A0A0E9N0I6_9BACT|nr:putative glycosidase [Flavihumibacter petaseus NBRC 106054]